MKKTAQTENDRIGNILLTLECAREQAKNCKTEDISMIVDSAFNLCLSIYCFQLRNEYPAAGRNIGHHLRQS